MKEMKKAKTVLVLLGALIIVMALVFTGCDLFGSGDDDDDGTIETVEDTSLSIAPGKDSKKYTVTGTPGEYEFKRLK